MGKAFGVRPAARAESVECPREGCRAAVNVPCAYLSGPLKGQYAQRRAHPERVSAAIKARQEREKAGKAS